MTQALTIIHSGDSSQNAIDWNNTRPLPDLGDIPAPHTVVLCRGNLNQLTANRATERERLAVTERDLNGGQHVYEDTFVTGTDRGTGWVVPLAEDLSYDGYTIGVVTRLLPEGASSRVLVLGGDSAQTSVTRGFRWEIDSSKVFVRHANNVDDSRAFASTVPVLGGDPPEGLDWALVTLRYAPPGSDTPEGVAPPPQGQVMEAWPGLNRFNTPSWAGTDHTGGTLSGPIGLMLADFFTAAVGQGNSEIAALFAWSVPVSQTDQVAFNGLIKPWLAQFDVDIWPLD